MNNTAELVAAALETEYKGYKNSELRHIEAVNDGKEDRVPLAPLPSLTVPTEDQLAEAFKAQRFDWWHELFDADIDLADAAGMLQGFSQTMTMCAKFVDAHKSHPRAPRPIGKKLVDEFTLMRRHMDRAIQKSELCAAEGKFAPDELIEWAREKGFVADEVLAAWEAYQAKKLGQSAQQAAPINGQTKRWTPEEIQRLEAYRSTKTEDETAKHFGVSGPRVRAILKKHRESTKPKPTSPFAGLVKR